MQAAFYVRQKQKQRRKKIRRDRLELPSNVATKEIAPFPRYPPNQWVRSETHRLPNSMSVFRSCWHPPGTLKMRASWGGEGGVVWSRKKLNHFMVIYVNNKLGAQFLFLYIFFSILYMFRAAKCSSSGESTVSVRPLVYVTLCR